MGTILTMGITIDNYWLDLIIIRVVLWKEEVGTAHSEHYPRDRTGPTVSVI